MVHLSTALVALAATSVASAMPMQKRIAQTIADSTTKWVAACTAAGGGSQCNTVSQNAFQTLLAAGKNCDQQDAADQMVDLAKTLNNNQDMITLSQIFAQQPRNAPDSLQVPYCQTAPKNAELNGFFHCQFSSSNFAKFSGDQTGNLPLGVTAVNPPGSCPANTGGPVPDGVQLNTLVTSPGTPQGSGGAGAATSANSTAVDSSAASNSTGIVSANSTTTDSSSASNSTGIVSADSTSTDSSAATNSTGDASASNSTSAAGSDSSDAGAADSGSGAVGADSSAAAGDDSGAAAGTDSGAAAPAAATSSAAAAPAASAGADNAAAAGAKSFTLQNGKDAQSQNKQFAGLSASSACQEGSQACVGGGFGQCVSGKFQVTQCSGGTQCFALPLVNKAGTSVTCTTPADAQSRIAATGATGGVDGS